MAWFSGVKKEGKNVRLLGFLKRVVAATMGCFFYCFRAKHSHSRLKATPEKERLVPRDRNSPSAIFVHDAVQESEDDLIRKTEEGWGPISEEIDIREIKEEKLKPKDALLDESSKPVNTCGKWVTGEGFLVDTPGSCSLTGHNTGRDSISSTQSGDDDGAVTPIDAVNMKDHCSAVSAFATTVQRTNKSVRFASNFNSSSESSIQRVKQSGSSGDSSISMPSPYPTPLHSTDEMQTPGTVFPSYMNNIAGGITRTRSQYVYSVLNPIEYESEWKELNKENSDPNRQRESLTLKDEATLISTPISGMFKDDLSLKMDRKEELSLSEWVKSHAVNQDGSNGKASEDVRYGRTSGDRPILGMVTAHWNDEEATQISPKWWGGNGIPNSTTKYKEDQKVSWHATPFEERLEKALFGDTFISQRKQMNVNPPVEFDKCEESDTASISFIPL